MIKSINAINEGIIVQQNNKYIIPVPTFPAYILCIPKPPKNNASTQ